MSATCLSCLALRRALLLGALAWLPARAFGRAPPDLASDPMRAAWFANQKNMMGGSCCQLGDGHRLGRGDVRYDPATGLYSVLLPDPSEETFGHSLDEHFMRPKRWVGIVPDKLRDPAGGRPPVSEPIVWFDTGMTYGMAQPMYRIYCFEPNTQA